MSDQFLYDFQEPPKPKFARSLYTRINTPMKTQTFPLPRFARSAALGSALVVLALTLTLVFSPGARAYAGNLLGSLNHWLFSDEPTYAEQYEAKLSSSKAGEQPADTELAPEVPAPVEWQAPALLSLAEASAQAGFNAAQIADLPAGLSLVARFVSLPDAQNPFTAVTSTYSGEGRSLVFSQRVYKAGAGQMTLPVGDATVNEVVVQGVTGVWIENLRLSTYVNDSQQVEPQYASLLAWEKDGVEYRLQSTPGMSLEEMLALARSIQP